MPKRRIEKFLNDLEAVKKTASEAALKVSSDFNDDDLDYITQIAYLKAWESKTNYEGKPQPHEWFTKIAKNQARNLLKKSRKSEAEERQAEISESSLDDEYRLKKLKSLSHDEAYEEAITYIEKCGLFLEEERLVSMTKSIAGKESIIFERELTQIIETTCYLHSAYLRASRGIPRGKMGEEEKDKHLDRMRFFNERNHRIPETFINAMTGDWNAIKLLIALYPRWLLADFDDKDDFKIIRKHIFYRLLGLVTKSDDWGEKLSKEELEWRRKTFEELYSSDFSHTIPSVVLRFLVNSFQGIYQAAIEIPYSLKDEVQIPESLEEIMIKMSQGERISLIPAEWGESQRIVTEGMWKTYAKKQPEKYGGNSTANSMAYYMTSKATGISITTIRKRIKSISQT
jgi:DNA-directed RNA polymerase specialized sigma24 family protein